MTRRERNDLQQSQYTKGTNVDTTSDEMQQNMRQANLKILKEMAVSGGGKITYEGTLALQWAINELEGKPTGDQLIAFNCTPPKPVPGSDDSQNA